MINDTVYCTFKVVVVPVSFFQLLLGLSGVAFLFIIDNIIVKTKLLVVGGGIVTVISRGENQKKKRIGGIGDFH